MTSDLSQRQPLCGPQISRRHVLTGLMGTVAVSILGVPSMARATGQAQVGRTASTVPGIASQRIDGVAKVTGQKVYARDFNARDMDGWPDLQWYGMYLRALTTQGAFLGLDLSTLPEAAKPRRVILGDQLSDAMRAPRTLFRRDLAIDLQLQERYQAQRADPSFDRPDAVVFDLIVQPGNRPDFLGQAVALLVFDDIGSFRAAQRAMQFQDARFQRYEAALERAPAPAPGQPFFPQTTYVKYQDAFSYATADPDTYMAQVPNYRARIDAYLDAHPEFPRQSFMSRMRAMDPMFMEPETGLVWQDRATGTMNLVLGTQSPDHDVENILSMYDTPDAPFALSGITLTSCYPGGGFGGRDSSPFSLMLALAGAYADGNPLRLAYDRFEQFRVGLKRHAADISGELVVAPDMTLQSVQMDLTFDGGGRKNLSPYVASLAALCAGGSYTVPFANIHAKALHTENISGGSQRGFGGPQAFFAIETALDDLAVGQGWDPFALRRKNLLTPGDATVVGGPIRQELRLAEMLDIAEAHPAWADRDAIKADYARRGLTYGTGMAMSLQAYGTSGDGMIAAILIEPDGALTVQSGAVDMGNGSATTLGVVIGDILGANAAQVDMGGYTLWGQTGLTTDDPEGLRWDNPKWTAKSVGSSSACLTGLHQVHTVQQTAHGLMAAAVLPAARQIWGLGTLDRSQVTWTDGQLVFLPGGKDALPWPQIAGFIHANGLPRGALGHAYFQDIWSEADFPTDSGLVRLQLDGLSLYQTGSAGPVRITRQNTTGPDRGSKRYARYVWAPCVNVVGLAVDRRTGIVQTETVLSVLNAGRVHVPQLVSGQSQGGVAMAISYTLLEDMPPGMAGPADGRWNLHRYHVARAQDVPLATRLAPHRRSQELIVLPESPGDGKAGRGIAEAVMCSVPPAISNALRDAVGVRYADLPITPEVILKGLNP
ncbi:molybdopterin cofactor-binding domain-containing protein [Aestuariivita sp.]|uniref:xanthine dehydrogenase family protein molybdopterin-binding subunit n=1 Tax=Aestuariivita sp. TaxID=1872407 RepID=UPI0021714EC1|nr:molybdopterin cofactor-binding domain-containing protein [Aestuariivita sp.]MCE8006851.1 xanthine dehydrogenase family protein molybdopterin-binding subunit [Aestuariivita sp.]